MKEERITQHHVTEAKALLERASSVTILTHINPDADTIGTGLGIYVLLKKMLDVSIEIVNISPLLPHHLDFLSGFEKIKKKCEFKESLIITCDGGSVDRFGMIDFGTREVINIDHHQSNTYYGTLNIVLPSYASASQVAYRLFEQITTISKEAAYAFYTALFSDTMYFTTASVNQEVFRVASELIAYGVDVSEVAHNLTQRRSLAFVRILAKGLDSLKLHYEGKVAIMSISQEVQHATGATLPDMDGIVEYGRSLAIVEIAILIIELPNGGVKISFRSKHVDIAQVATALGGGGHKLAAGCMIPNVEIQEIIDTILEQISQLGLV